MRLPSFLLGGMLLVGTGIVLIATGAPWGWVLGPVLIVLGLVLKGVGMLVSDDTGGPARRERGRTSTTLGGAVVERPRAGIPAGRAPLRTVGAHTRPAGPARPAAPERPAA